jgi:hypothetical protein
LRGRLVKRTGQILQYQKPARTGQVLAGADRLTTSP